MMRTPRAQPPTVSPGTALLLLALAAGVFLRFSGIGTYGFWTDELFHVFAAKSYLQDGTYHVPWDPREYTRALPVTLLTAMSFRFFGESEASARVLFALTNIVFIVIAYRILKQLFSRNVGLIFVIAISLSIFSIQMSQECRMYTLFQLFYFLMSIAFFRGIEPTGPVAPGGRTALLGRVRARLGLSPTHIVLALGLALIAARLQILTVNFVLVVFTYCATMFAYRWVRHGPASALRTRYAAITLSMAIAALLLVVTENRWMALMGRIAAEVPAWNRSAQSNFDFYRHILTQSHPILWTIYPLGAFVAIRRHGRLGLYFVLSFTVLFILHCVFLSRKSERYIFQLLPFFITVAAVGVDFVLSTIVAVIARRTSPSAIWTRRALYAALIVSVCLVVYPRLERTVLDTSVPKFSNWKDLDPAMVRLVRNGPSITTDRLRFNYYFGQYPNFVIDASDLDHVGGERVIANMEEFEQAFARYPDSYVVTYDKHLFNDAFVGPSVREHILSELIRVDGEDDGRVMVFRRAEGGGD